VRSWLAVAVVALLACKRSLPPASIRAVYAVLDGVLYVGTTDAKLYSAQ
jgi:hypothetical protein